MSEQYATESISAGGVIPSVRLQQSQHVKISVATQREGERWIPFGDIPARDGSSYRVKVSIFNPQR